jgi:Putative lumazine-binding
MKKMVLIALIFIVGMESNAQQSKKMEYIQEAKDAIREVLETKYFMGIYAGNVDLLSQAFNSGTLLFGDVKQQPYAKTLVEYLDGVKNRQSPRNSGQPFNGSIICIKVVNSIGIAEVKVKMYEFLYHEFLSFHQINGKWLIVNKMITDTYP